MKSEHCLLAWLLLYIALGFSVGSAQQSGKRLWVLQEPGMVVEYDLSTWAVLNTIRVPAEFLRDPDSLQINHDGQMLFCADPQIQFGNPNQHYPINKVWLWNGKLAEILDRGPNKKAAAASRNDLTVENRRMWALSSNSRQLYWFENEFWITKNEDGADVSVSTNFRVWQADLNGGQRSQIAGFPFPACKCDTGACSETCPEASFWFPPGGVDDFFFVNRWIPGQIDAT